MVIQAAGRSVRSKDDWGETYILDRTALKLIKKYEKECPDWFLERLRPPPGEWPRPDEEYVSAPLSAAEVVLPAIIRLLQVP